MTNARAAAALGVSAAANEVSSPGPKSITALLAELKPQIQAALPRHMTAERMSRIVLTEMRKVPKLFQCDAKSLLGAVIQAAQLGLEPGSALGHCYLLPFDNRRKQIVECQLLLGYRGMIELARRSGQIEMIYAMVVRKEDDFKIEYGLNPHIHHVPDESSEELVGTKDSIRGAYAVAKLRGGGVQFEYLPIKQIEGIRKRSRAANDGPWVTDFEEMCKKTAVRRLFKYLPVSVELQGVVSVATNLDTSVDLGESQGLGEIIDGESREINEDPNAPASAPDAPVTAAQGDPVEGAS